MRARRVVGRVVVAAAVGIIVLGGSAIAVLATAFHGATAETPKEMFAVEYGWPIVFAESDASMGSSLQELRGRDFEFPTIVPFNPWENPTSFDGGAFLMMWGTLSGFCLAVVAAAFWLVPRRRRA